MANSAGFPATGRDDEPPAGRSFDAVGETSLADASRSQDQGFGAATEVEPEDTSAPASGSAGETPPVAVDVLQAEEIRATPAWLATLRRMWGRDQQGAADPEAGLEDAAPEGATTEDAAAEPGPVGESATFTPVVVEVVVEAAEDPHAEFAEDTPASGEDDREGAAEHVDPVADRGDQTEPAQPSQPQSDDHEPSEVAARERLLAGLSGLAPENDGPGAAAFFDVDNTTIRGSSFVALAKGMAERNYFTTAEIMAMSWKQFKFVVSGTENLDDIAEATENGLQFVKGREVTEIQTISDEVYDEKLVNRLWAGTLALTEAHLAAGHQVWLVSATPQEVAELLAARLGLTGGLGTVAEVVDGRYTGKLLGGPLHGQAKAKVVAALAASHGLDLQRCSAYSDSANDIPMMSIVGHPVAINPDSKLRSYARAQGWPVRDYRFRGKESVRKGLPAAAAAGLIAGAAVGVAKGVSSMRGRNQ